MDVKRIITGLLLGATWLGVLWYGPFYLFWLLVVIVGAIGLGEYGRLALPGEPPLLRKVSILLGILPVVSAYSGRLEVVAASLFLTLLIGAASMVVNYNRLDNALDSLFRLLFGVFYVGFCFAHMILLMKREDGAAWLLFLSAIMVAADTGAYYAGRAFGATKLCPAVSPGKTVEGLIGGLLAAGLAAVAVNFYYLPRLSLGSGIFWALVLATIGALGDLTESVIKRTAGIKDSGSLLPGHGGILDRLDSTMFAAPVLFYLVDLGIL